MALWQPNQDGLNQILALYRYDDANNQHHQQIYQQIESLSQHMEFCNYLVFILVHMGNESVKLRQTAGLHLKTHLLNNYNSIHSQVKEYVKATIVQALADPQDKIRATAANVISNVASRDSLKNWKTLLPTLIQAIDSQNQNLVLGAFTAISNVCEDAAQKLDEEGHDRPSNVLIPKLIGFLAHPHQNIRRDALNSLNQFLLLMPQALAINMDKYLQGLFRLTMDTNKDIRKSVCHAFCGLLEVRLDWLQPHMENVIKFMLMVSQDADEEVALQACEFWAAYCETKAADTTLLAKYLHAVVPILLKGMVYSEVELAILGNADGEDDENVADQAKDMAPRFHEARSVSYVDEADEDASDSEDEWDDFSEWNLRKCSAASLDLLANIYKDQLLPHLLPNIDLCFREDAKWTVRESGILALGAVAEGCFSGLEKHLSQLVPYLIRSLVDARPLIRSITCWTLSRYSKWIMKEKSDEKYFQPLMAELLKRILDKNKKVQEAACSAFATLEEEAQDRLLPYLGPILQNLMFAFNKYQAKNMLILYDAIGTLAEAVGVALNRPEFINILMPPLMHKWNQLQDDDRSIFPLLECLTAIAQAIKVGFAHYAAPVYARCLGIIEKNLAMQRRALQQKAQNEEYELPDKEFVVCALDLLSGLAEGLGPSIESLVGGHANTLALLFECVKDTNPDVRQSAFALLGDLAKACIGHIRPHLDKFLPIAAQNLNPTHISVCNNASWAIGEIAMKIGHDIKPYIPQQMQHLVPIITKQDLVRNLLENASITIGRLGYASPESVSPFLLEIAMPWCAYLSGIREDTEKEHAFRGLCSVVQHNPRAILPAFSAFCTAIASWQKPSEHMLLMFSQILHSFKQSLGTSWTQYFATANESTQQRLIAIYRL